MLGNLPFSLTISILNIFSALGLGQLRLSFCGPLAMAIGTFSLSHSILFL